jgi:hypothetical protein
MFNFRGMDKVWGIYRTYHRILFSTQRREFFSLCEHMGGPHGIMTREISHTQKDK